MDVNRRKRRTSSVLAESSDPLNRNRGKMQLRHSSSFINTDTVNRRANDDLIQNLMQNPENRALLLRLLSQEKDAIIKNKERLQFNGSYEKGSMPKNKRNKARFESPSALWKRLAMKKQQASESGSVSSDQLPPIVASQTVPFEKLLEGVIGFVELKCRGEDRSAGAKKLMIAMGAEIRDTLTKDVTHVVFKDGTFNTYYKAKLLKIHLVSVLWLDAIKTMGIRVPEQKFPALGFSSRDHDLSKICVDFQNDYEELIQDEFQKTLALTTEILSQSFNSDFVTKRKKTSGTKNVDSSPSSEENFTNPDSNDLNCLPPSDKQLSTQNWLQDITNSSLHSDQLDSSNSFSDIESDCGMIDGCSVKKSKELQWLNQSISNSLLEIDGLIETTHNVKGTFMKSEIRNLLLKENKEEKEQQSYSRGTHSTSTSESKSLLTGRNLRRSSRISMLSESRSSNGTEKLPSLRLSTDTEQKRKSDSTNLGSRSSNGTEKLSLRLSTDTAQKRKSDSNNLRNGIKEGNTEVKGSNLVGNVSSTMSSLRISSGTINSNNDTSKGKSSVELESEKSNGKLKRSENNQGVTNRPLNEKQLNQKFKKESRNLIDKSTDLSTFSVKASSSNRSPDINLAGKATLNIQTNLSDKAEMLLHSLENTTNQLVHETENMNDSSFTKIASKTKQKRRKLFNPDDFSLEEGNSENEDGQKNLKVSGKNLEGKQPIVSLNSRILKEYKASTSCHQEDEKQTKKNLTKSKTKSDECQENISPTKKNLDKRDSHCSESEVDSSPTKKSKHAKEKLIKDLAARRSLRIQTKKFTQKGLVATPDLMRRSSFDFVPKEKVLSQNKVRKSKTSTIVCTRLHRPDVQTFMQIVRKLGTFHTEDEVSEKTTHLVAGESRRTINMLRALARGCWILKIEWLYKSLEVGQWVEEEDYELTEFSPAVQQCRKQRQAFGSLYSMDIFENVGAIFVSQASVPRRSDLEELIVLCKGTTTRTMSTAFVIVGEATNMKRVVCVSEKWVLDSIMYNKKKPFKNYLLKLNDKRESKEF